MRSYTEFKEAMGKRESDNNYKIVNQFGYLGKYQFGKPRLFDLGLSVNGWHPANIPPRHYITKEDFLEDEHLQEIIFDSHIKELSKRVAPLLSSLTDKKFRYKGNEYNYNLSGLVAGSHLVGIGGIKKFINGIDITDGNNVSPAEYLYLFMDYQLI